MTASAAGGQVPAVGALIQFAVSAIAVGLMIAIAAWGTRGRAAPPLDDASARRWLDDEFPGRPIDGLWLACDGRGAVARSGEAALVLSRMGDGYVARKVAWSSAASAAVRDGRIRIAFADAAAPGAVLAMPAWPPGEAAA